MTRFTCNSYNIKTHRPNNTMIAHISVSSLYQTKHFSIRNSLYRITKTIISTSLNFHKDKFTILLCHDINFFMSESPITITYHITMSHEIGSCTVFAY